MRGLKGAGIEAAAIHGNKSQGQRTAALQAFRAGQIKILVATDIAARGIDVPGVSHVFNFEIPNVPEQYVHRIGRTARAGAAGVAMSFVAGDERAYLKDIERLTGMRAQQIKLPEGFRESVANLPPPAKKSNKEQKRQGGRGRPGQNRRKAPVNGGRGRDGDTAHRSRPRQGGWQPDTGPKSDTRDEGGQSRDRRPTADRALRPVKKAARAEDRNAVTSTAAMAVAVSAIRMHNGLARAVLPLLVRSREADNQNLPE